MQRHLMFGIPEKISPGIFEVLAFRNKTTYNYERPFHANFVALILQQSVNNNVKLLKATAKNLMINHRGFLLTPPH